MSSVATIDAGQTDQKTEHCSVGQKIKQARESLGLTVQQLTEQLKISAEKINIIEEDAYPEAYINIYYRGYVRLIARHLQLNANELLSGLRAQGYDTDIQPPQRNQTPMPYKAPLQINPKKVLFFTTLLLIIGIAFHVLQSQPQRANEDASPKLLDQLTETKHHFRLNDNLSTLLAPSKTKAALPSTNIKGSH